MTAYTSIKVPKALAEEVGRFIRENPERGYRNRTEFILEAIRRKLSLDVPLLPLKRDPSER